MSDVSSSSRGARPRIRADAGARRTDKRTTLQRRMTRLHGSPPTDCCARTHRLTKVRPTEPIWPKPIRPSASDQIGRP